MKKHCAHSLAHSIVGILSNSKKRLPKMRRLMTDFVLEGMTGAGRFDCSLVGTVIRATGSCYLR